MLAAASGKFRPKILVVDDDRDSLEYVGEIFRRDGRFEVVQALGAGEGFDKIEQDQFDAFVLDIRMPSASGLDICSAIRATSRHEKTPVVFLSGFLDTPEARAQAFGVGGCRLLHKPVDIDALTSSVSEAVSKRSGGPGDTELHLARAVVDGVVHAYSTPALSLSIIARRLREIGERVGGEDGEELRNHSAILFDTSVALSEATDLARHIVRATNLDPQRSRAGEAADMVRAISLLRYGSSGLLVDVEIEDSTELPATDSLGQIVLRAVQTVEVFVLDGCARVKICSTPAGGLEILTLGANAPII